MGYTDETVYLRDIKPGSADGTFPRLLATANRIAYDHINSRLASTYTVPFDSPYPAAIVSISDLLTTQIVNDLKENKVPFTPKPGVKGGTVYEFVGNWLTQLVKGHATLTEVDPIAKTASWESW